MTFLSAEVAMVYLIIQHTPNNNMTNIENYWMVASLRRRNVNRPNNRINIYIYNTIFRMIFAHFLTDISNGDGKR